MSALVALYKGRNIDDPKAWLVTVLNRKFYDTLRRKYKMPTICHDAIIETADYNDDFDNIIKSKEAEAIRREIAFLTKLYREVIVRHYMNGESVEQIAICLNIPIGTVKSRLFGGRKQIKKGIDIMDTYSKPSYQPERLKISCSGTPGLNDEPFSVVDNDLIAQNILLIAYDEPIAEGDISKAIGVPTAYIEPIVEKLVIQELMKRIGNKVYTDFILYRIEDKTKYLSAEKKLIAENFGLFWQPINDGLLKLRATDAYSKLNNHQRNKLEYYFTIHSLEIGVFGAGAQIYNGHQDFPDRPNGGRWVAFGNVYPEGYDYTKAEDYKYGFAGERKAYWEKFLSSKSICLHEYDTIFDGFSRYSNLEYPIHCENLVQMLYIIDSNINPDDTGYNLMFFENVPKLAERGILKVDDDGTKVDIPVLSLAVFKELEAICKSTTEAMIAEIKEPLSRYLQNAKQSVPKHLTSVPEQKQYLPAMKGMAMMVVFEAKDKGLIFKDVDFPCPPMVLVVDK